MPAPEHSTNHILNEILNKISHFVFWKDKNGVYLGCNTAFARVAGLARPEEIVGKTDFDLSWPREMANIFSAYDKEVMESQQPRQHIIKQFQLEDGTVYWIDLIKAPMIDENGCVNGVLGIYEDITKQKQTEEALLKTQYAVDHVSDEILWVDRNATIVYANQAVSDHMGYTREELHGGMTIFDIDLNFTRDHWRSYWQTLSQKKQVTFESVHRSKDGRIYPVEITANYIQFGDTEISFSITRDISARKQSEEAFHLNESRLESLVQLSQMTVASMQELASFAMEEGIRLTKSKIGYVAFLTEDEQTLTMYAWSEKAMQDCAIIEKPWVYPLSTTGLWGEAVRQRKPIITNDYSAPSSLKKGLPEGHAQLTRHMNVPVFDGNQIVMVAGVANKDSNYDDSDVRQLTLLMDGMWKIIQRNRAQEQIHKTNRLLRVLSEVNQALIRAKDEPELLQSVCQILVNFCGYRMAWIGYAENDKDKHVRPVAQAGEADEYLNAVNVSWADNEAGSEPTGVAIRTNEPAIESDLAMNQNEHLWQIEALHCGFASAISIPIRLDSRVSGAVSLYSDKVNAFNSEEIKLLLELANDLCYGITALRVREDRSRVLQALQENEEKFRGITETVASGICLYQNSRFIYVNPATEAITGYSRQELMQMTPWGFVHPDYISIVQEYGLSRQRGESAPTRYECKILTRGGEERWVDVSAGTMLLNGMHTGVVSLIDITKRKKIDDELRDSQHRMADLINFLPDATFAVDLQGRVIVWNHAVEELTGVKAEEILGKSNYEYAQAFYGQRRPMLIDLVKSSNEEILDELYQLLKREDKVLLGEGYTPAIQPGGAYFWGKATALYDSDGNVVGYIESVRNITDRKRAEDELRRSEERYRKLYESMIDGFVMFDMDGQICEYNQAFKEMLGYTDDELHQLTRADITPEKWHDYERHVIEPVILTRGYSDLYEKEYRRKDGTVFPIELRVNLLRDNNGKPIRMWGIVRDITERKRIEKDKRQFYRETIRSVTDGKLDITPIEATQYYVKHNEISLEFRTAAELSNARQQIESYCISNHFPEDSRSVFTTAVGEAMTNALKHAGGGVVLAGKEGGELWAGVSDTGPGIATLTLPGATLRRGYSTKVSMGMGYSIMLDISDRILLSTGPEGTTVILFKMLERPRPQISLDDLPDIWETIPNTSTC